MINKTISIFCDSP